MAVTPPESATEPKPTWLRKYLLKSNREMTIAAVSFAAGGMLMGFGCGVHLYCCAYGTPPLKDLGPFLSGSATWAGVAGAGVGWAYWGKRKAQEKRAEVAGAAITVAFDFCEMLRDVCVGGHLLHEEKAAFDVDANGEWRKRLINQLENAELSGRLVKARGEVEAYIPDEHCADALYELSERKQYMLSILQLEEIDWDDIYTADERAAVFSETTEKIDGEYAKAKEFLGEYAAFGAKRTRTFRPVKDVATWHLSRQRAFERRKKA